MAMEAIKGAGMTYQGSVSSAESQPKTDSAVKAAETDAPEKGIVSENIKQAGEENVNTSQGADQPLVVFLQLDAVGTRTHVESFSPRFRASTSVAVQ